MASMGDLQTICTNIVQVLRNLEDLNSSTLSKEFTDEVGSLRTDLEFYRSEIIDHREPDDGRMMARLRKAESILDEAEPTIKYLKRMQACLDSDGSCSSLGWWLYAKLSLVLFPGKLEGTLKKVQDEIKRISDIPKDEADLRSNMEKRGRTQRSIYTVISNDNDIYVPIQDSQDQVTSAIESLSSPPIILLHGGVGKGKSTLARYVCAHYGKKELFQYVILVLCGGNRSGNNSSTKQFEIWQELSNDLSSTPNKDTSSKQMIEKALQTFLNNHRVLIILDDVSDQDFLQDMWTIARNSERVKYLITSRDAHLCDCLRNVSKPIEMGDPKRHEAMTMLASLAGLKDKCIPKNLEVS